MAIDMISPFKCNVRLTAGFPFYPSGKRHSGVDYVPIDKTDEKNWNLYAVSNGNIVFGRNDVYGNYVIIHNQDLDVRILYAHLDSFSPYARTLSYVEQGAFIGVAGNTGNSTGRHLHIEVFRGNTSNKLNLDPRAYISFNGEVVTNMWMNGSTIERLYSCVEHAYHQYDDVAHMVLPPRKEGTLVYVVPYAETNIYCVQFELGTGTCIGFVKYRGGV